MNIKNVRMSLWSDTTELTLIADAVMMSHGLLCLFIDCTLGAVMIGNMWAIWAISADAEKSKDTRIKTGNNK